MKSTVFFLLFFLCSLWLQGQHLMEAHTGIYNAGAYDRSLTVSVYDNGHVVISDAILTGEDLADLDAGVWAFAALDLEIDFYGRTLHIRRDGSGKLFARWGNLDEFPLKRQEGC